jgi:hypothetical protein
MNWQFLKMWQNLIKCLFFSKMANYGYQGFNHAGFLTIVKVEKENFNVATLTLGSRPK